jgi:predicted metal-binding protein
MESSPEEGSTRGSCEMSVEKDLEILKELALEWGAISTQVIPAHEVVFDERTVYKCQYGCPSYGRFLTCPPFTPLPSEFEKALRTYEWAIMVECDLADLNRLVVEVEKAAMRSGYYLALGLKGHRCYLCEECVPPGEPCRDPLNARPSMSGLGINVFATLKKAGLERKLAMDGEGYTSWGMVLID